MGVGVGVGAGVGVGVGDGVGDGVGVGLGVGVGDGVGLGVGDGVGLGDGVGAGVGDGLGVGVAPLVGGGVATLPALLMPPPPPQAAIVNASTLADAALIPRIPTIVIPRWGCAPASRRHPVEPRGAGLLETGMLETCKQTGANAFKPGGSGHTRPPPGHRTRSCKPWPLGRLCLRGFHAPAHRTDSRRPLQAIGQSLTDCDSPKGTAMPLAWKRAPVALILTDE